MNHKGSGDILREAKSFLLGEEGNAKFQVRRFIGGDGNLPYCHETYPDDFSLCRRDGAQLVAQSAEWICTRKRPTRGRTANSAEA
jgi:hypothetical protein